ncbi:MAG: putative porin [Bacteroidia bacterium]|nr:putative porin [Bacteroidia bacterium]MDW8417005.1 putative porin [Bacteroidia bacterium]
MDFLPWHDPLDTLIGFLARQGYYKPYILWREGAIEYERVSEPSIFPLNQAVYILSSVPIAWSTPPYTRVRFDQCSRKTQLLSIHHGQTSRQGNGLSLVYRRRTRVGEYLGQTTDHYNFGLSLYAQRKRWWARSEGGWNQLQDGIYGGVLYTDSPQSAFQKERQPVRMNGARLRRWYRYAEGEIGLRLSSSTGSFIKARLAEDRMETETLPALRSESTLYPDTLPSSGGGLQILSTAEVGLRSRWWKIGVQYIQDRGKMRTSEMKTWSASAIESYFAAETKSLSIQLRYRRWIAGAALPATFSAGGQWKTGAYETGFSYNLRNLPWMAYQMSRGTTSQNEQLIRIWAERRFIVHDTTISPPRLRIWLARWNGAWLADSVFRSRSPFMTTGTAFTGGWRKGHFGFIAGISLQRPWSSEKSWHETVPLLNGWIQPFLRWQINKTPPIYHFGVRISGFTKFRPMAYALPVNAFYLEPNYSGLLQGPYIWTDPYFVVLIRRVMIYLRVEHATEGLLADGYYLSAWYPMPGRGFSFGVQWDIYN